MIVFLVLPAPLRSFPGEEAEYFLLSRDNYRARAPTRSLPFPVRYHAVFRHITSFLAAQEVCDRAAMERFACCDGPRRTVSNNDLSSPPPDKSISMHGSNIEAPSRNFIVGSLHSGEAPMTVKDVNQPMESTNIID